MLAVTEQSSDACRAASVSEMDHEQTASVSSIVTDRRQNSLFVRISSFWIELASDHHLPLTCYRIMVELFVLAPVVVSKVTCLCWIGFRPRQQCWRLQKQHSLRPMWCRQSADGAVR